MMRLLPCYRQSSDLSTLKNCLNSFGHTYFLNSLVVDPPFKREAAQELAAALDKASVTLKQRAEVVIDAAVSGCTFRHEQRDDLTGKQAAALHEQGVIHSGVLEQET